MTSLAGRLQAVLSQGGPTMIPPLLCNSVNRNSNYYVTITQIILKTQVLMSFLYTHSHGAHTDKEHKQPTNPTFLDSRNVRQKYARASAQLSNLNLLISSFLVL